MIECKHVFEGRADGVHCKVCGLHMTATEYREYLQPKEEPKKPTRKRVQKDD